MDPKIIEQHGLSSEEFKNIERILGREPNLVELGLYSVLWSEHCSYKSSRIHLKKFPTKGPHILQGPGENAGVIDIGDGYAVTMKIESHNHPSAVEPFQGAATGVGGIVRDVFTMGARPIASLNSLRFGPLTDPRNRYLFDGVVSGISSYGNCLGLPTVAGEVYFDPCYSGNCLVNAMCVGLIKVKGQRSKVKSDEAESEIPEIMVKAKAEGIGNPILYVGSSTGRDGIHGATFASVELGEDSVEKKSNVQVGDPFTEKLLIEACLELIKTGNIVGMQDMGAAGLTSSSSEMASRAGTGIEIDISKVPQREENMTPYEIMLSESQERMLVCMKKGTEEDAFRIFKKWGLNAVTFGKVTGDGMLRVKVGDEVVAEVPARSLADDAPIYDRPSQKSKGKRQKWKSKAGKSFNDKLVKYLSDPNIASKAWVYEQYDHMVQTNTSVAPGKADAAVLRIKGTDKMISLTTDCNGAYCQDDPYTGGLITVAEAARNLVCTGAKPLAVTDCLNFGNPEKPAIMNQFVECLRGMTDGCLAFNTPVVSGNVSFYNETEKGAIYPTPVVGMLGLIENKSNSYCTMGFKDEGDIIVLLGRNKAEQHVCPSFDQELERSVQRTAYEAIRLGAVKSAHDTSEGGLSVALAESCIEGGIGAVITLDDKLKSDQLLFAESQSRIIMSISPDQIFVINDLATLNNTPMAIIGKVGSKALKISSGGKQIINVPLGKLEEAYKGSIPSLMGA